ncbi:MAG: cobalamin biosynthesis protein, partial [Pseudomonadota bacterium]
MSLLLIAAHLLDAVFGEPRALWSRVPHPVVLIGRLIGGLERAWNRGQMRREKGVGLAALLVVGGITLGAMIAGLPGGPVWELLIAA